MNTDTNSINLLCIVFTLMILFSSCEKYKPILKDKYFKGHIALVASSKHNTGLVVLDAGEDHLAYGVIYSKNTSKSYRLDDSVYVTLQSFDDHTFAKVISQDSLDFEEGITLGDFADVDQYLSINFHNATAHGSKNFHVAGHIQFMQMNGANYLDRKVIDGVNYYRFLYKTEGSSRIDTLLSVYEPPKDNIKYWLELKPGQKVVKDFPKEHKHIGHKL